MQCNTAAWLVVVSAQMVGVLACISLCMTALTALHTLISVSRYDNIQCIMHNQSHDLQMSNKTWVTRPALE